MDESTNQPVSIPVRHQAVIAAVIVVLNANDMAIAQGASPSTDQPARNDWLRNERRWGAQSGDPRSHQGWRTTDTRENA